MNKKYITIPTKGFEKEIGKLTDVEKALVFVKVAILEENPSHPSLCTHKMRGKKRYFESYVNMDIRIVWQFGDGNTILLTDVGHHDVLKKYLANLFISAQPTCGGLCLLELVTAN